MVLVVVALAVLFRASSYDIYVANLAILAAVAALGLNLLTGYTGQVSVGNAAFLAIGAYTAVAVMARAGFILGVAAAALATAAAGFVVGFPSLRLRGLYLVLSTLALQFIVAFAFEKYQTQSGAIAGYTLGATALGPMHLDSDRAWYVLLVVVLAMATYVAWSLVRSKPGRAWIAIREHDVEAAVIGVDVTRYKLLAFVISSGFVGVAGALAAAYTKHVSYEAYTLDLAVAYVAMIIIGGLASIVGSIIGAAIVTVLPFLITNAANSWFAGAAAGSFVQRNLPFINASTYALLVLVFLMFEPRGLVGLPARVVSAARRARGASPGSAAKQGVI